MRGVADPHRRRRTGRQDPAERHADRLVVDATADRRAIDFDQAQIEPATQPRGDGVELDPVDRAAGRVGDGRRRVHREGPRVVAQAQRGGVGRGEVDTRAIDHARGDGRRTRAQPDPDQRRARRRCDGRGCRGLYARRGADEERQRQAHLDQRPVSRASSHACNPTRSIATDRPTAGDQGAAARASWRSTRT